MSSLEERLSRLRDRLVNVRKDLADALLEADVVQDSPYVDGILDDSSKDLANKAVSLLSEQIDIIEDQLDGKIPQTPPSQARYHRYRYNPFSYWRNPGEEASAKKTIRGVLKDLTPCDKKDWGLRRFRYNPRHSYSQINRRSRHRSPYWEQRNYHDF